MAPTSTHAGSEVPPQIPQPGPFGTRRDAVESRSGRRRHGRREDPAGGGQKKRTAHDETFKKAFREFFADLVELVDPELAATLDLARATIREEDPFADFPAGQAERADLVAQTPTRDGEEEMVMVHVEVSGKFLEIMDRRMRRYGLHVEVKYDKPVVPIAVFLTGGPAGVAMREVSRPAGKAEFIRFEYLAFGLSGCLAEEWVNREQPLAGALAALMGSKIWDRVEQKIECLRAVERARVNESQRYMLATIVDTYVELDPEDKERYETALNREDNKGVHDMLLTWDEAVAHHRAEGRREGEALGEARGLLKATRGAIVLVAQRRNGSVPVPFVEALEKIDDLSRLYQLLEQVLRVDSLDQLDLEWPRA